VDLWAQTLGIHDALEVVIRGYDLIFVLLGDNCLRAVRLPVQVSAAQTIVFLASAGSVKAIAKFSEDKAFGQAKLLTLPLSNADAKRYQYGLVGLKGFLFKRFAEVAEGNGAGSSEGVAKI
jgi:hypothetical protein